VNDFLIYSLVGALTTWTIRISPIQRVLKRIFPEWGVIHELFDCDLCLGFWVFSALAFPFRMNLLYYWFEIPVLSEFLTGMITTFVVHTFKTGLQTKFTTIMVNNYDE